MNSLQNNIASGSYKISVEFLKSKQKSIFVSLSYIFNLFIEKNCIPNEFKHVDIVYISKNIGNKLDLNNYYRPIFSIFNIANIFEKCIYTRINNFLNKNNYYCLVFNLVFDEEEA